MNDKQILSATLKQHRKDLSLTQEQVAQVLEIDRSTYAYYESGRSCPSLEIAAKFAALFGVTVDALVRRAEDDTTNPRMHDEDFRFLRKEEQNLLLRYRRLSYDARDEARKYLEELHAEKA